MVEDCLILIANLASSQSHSYSLGHGLESTLIRPSNFLSYPIPDANNPHIPPAWANWTFPWAQIRFPSCYSIFPSKPPEFVSLPLITTSLSRPSRQHICYRPSLFRAL